jgi:hypothetical protein
LEVAKRNDESIVIDPDAEAKMLFYQLTSGICACPYESFDLELLSKYLKLVSSANDFLLSIILY